MAVLPGAVVAFLPGAVVAVHQEEAGVLLLEEVGDHQR